MDTTKNQVAAAGRVTVVPQTSRLLDIDVDHRPRFSALRQVSTRYPAQGLC